MDKSKSSRPASSQKAQPDKKSAHEKERITTQKETTEPKSSPTGGESSKNEKIISEEKLKKVGDRLSNVADKGVDILKDVFGKVKDFSVDATELTRLKVEIHRLKNERERLLTTIGQKVWKMRDREEFKEIKPLFTEDFNKLTELETAIKSKEKTAAKISI